MNLKYQIEIKLISREVGKDLLKISTFPDESPLMFSSQKSFFRGIRRLI